MALQTWVARFVVDHGRVTEEGGLLRTFQRRRLDEPDVDLHIIAEPTGAKSEELGAQALDAIGRVFLQDRLSISGGLLRALRGTNQTLLEWNRRSLPREQVSAGVTAAIVSGKAVYLAQAGPGLAFLRRDGRLQRLEAGDEAVTPLGGGDIQPALRRVDLGPGDILIAASLALEAILDDRTLEALLSRGSDEALPELYLMARDLPSFALFLVTALAAEEAPPEPPPAADAAASAPADAPARPAERRSRRPAGKAGTTPEEPVEEPAPPEDAKTGPLLAAPPPVDITRSVVRLRSDQAFGRSEYPRRTTGPARRFRFNPTDWRILRLALAAVVVLLVVAFVPELVQQGRSEKLDSLVEGAESQLAAAQAASDPALRRDLLEETRRLANEALRIDPENAPAGDLRQQASASLDVMDALFDLGPMRTVTTLSRQITGEVSIRSLAVAGSTAYLLDAKGGRIIALPLGTPGQPAIVYRDGETYAGTPAKKPIYFTWERAGGVGGRLLILDEERKLFALRAGSLPEPLPLRRTNTWASVAGIAAYDGNLYVLDPKGNQVHRYLPAATGFDSEPSSALSGPRNLGEAQGLAVDEDIFVFFRDGSVRRFQGGVDIGFNLGGIDRPPGAASDMALVASAEELFLADSANKRIVVAGEDGAFHRQLVSTAFTDLRAIAVDEAGGQLYVVVGDALLTAPIQR